MATKRERYCLPDSLIAGKMLLKKARVLPLEGIAVLDLFAGSGSLALEALSRGAATAVCVERNRQVLPVLEHNVHALGCDASVEIVAMDAMRYIELTDHKFGLIFADPPYGDRSTGGIPEGVFARGLLTDPGYLLIEHEPGVAFLASSLYSIGPEKRFGQTRVTFFHHRLEAHQP